LGHSCVGIQTANENKPAICRLGHLNGAETLRFKGFLPILSIEALQKTDVKAPSL
jgi:hypothetical protein